jgi:hypothetical protein
MRFDGRTEKRVTMAIPVCLVAAEKLHAEPAMTVNVSPHGARVTTRRRWLPEDQLRLASRSGALRAQVKVVYCEPLKEGHFCVGLKFHSAFMSWQPI